MAIDFRDDELDFKDRNNSFLRRPAAVTIKKPFLTTAEMSDLLLRTLRNYVPPAHRTVRTSSGGSGLGLIRAVVITYERINTEKLALFKKRWPELGDQITKITSLYEEYSGANLGKEDSIYIRPIRISVDQNLCIREMSDGESVTAVSDPKRKDIINSHYLLGTKIDNAHKYTAPVKPVSKKDKRSDSVNISSSPYIEDCFERYVRVYVFDKQDHVELNPSGEQNGSFFKSENPRHLTHAYYFNMFPRYLSSPQLVKFYIPPSKTTSKSSVSTGAKSPTKGIGALPQITDAFIKETFGAIPSSTIYAYQWDFAVPYGYEMHVVQESTLRRDYYEEASKEDYISRINTLSSVFNTDGIVRNIFYDTPTGSAMSAEPGMSANPFAPHTSAMAKVDVLPAEKTKELRDKFSAWFEATSTDIPKSIELAFDLRTECEKLSTITDAELLRRQGITPVAIDGGAFTDPKGFKKLAIPEAKELVEALHRYITTANGDSNDAQKTSTAQAFYTKHGLPFFGFLWHFYNLRLKARTEYLRELYTADYLVAKNPVHMTEKEFRVRYYCVLLKKLQEKLQEYAHFVDDKIIQIPVKSDIQDCIAWRDSYATKAGDEKGVANVGTKALALMNSDGIDTLFIKKMERVLFSSISGIYITSISDGTQTVKAPMWNATPESDDFKVTEEGDLEKLAKAAGNKDSGNRNQDILDTLTKTVELCNNKDVESISVSRVIQGISTATVVIKNDREKYNFPSSDSINKSRMCIDPMDQITIFLPDFDGKLRSVFSGFVSKVSAMDDGGYHSISIDADCNVKYLQINRTNVKPSTSRQESENNPLTAFTVPDKMFASINHFLPMMFAQSLTYFECQPRSLVSDTVPLFEESAVYRKVKKKVNVASNISVPKVEVKPTTVTAKMQTVEEDSNTEKETTKISVKQGTKTSAETVEAKNISVSYQDVEIETNAQPVETADNKNAEQVDVYSKVKFADPLFNYLWYKSASHYPKEEATYIDEQLDALLKDYVYTSVVSVDSSGASAVRVLVPGAMEPTKFLKDGKRCSYVIFKQRMAGTLTGPEESVSSKISSIATSVLEKSPFSGVSSKLSLDITPKNKQDILEDREIAAVIEGTSQPSFVLQGLGFSLQTSNWKTNYEIINEIADKFNFLFYTNNAGVVRFAPYNFDLTLLNTNKFTDTKINTVNMLLHRYMSTLNQDPNPLILKKKYLISYEKTDDETAIVNWLRLSGDWVIGGANELSQAVVINPVLIKKFGVRAAQNRTVIGIRYTDALRLYGLSWLDRQNKRYRSATISGLYDSRMDVNCPYYVPHDNIIYFCESLNIRYTPGSTCTYSMGATYGKKPILEITEDMISDKLDASVVQYSDVGDIFTGNIRLVDTTPLLAKLREAFIEKNSIAPTVYAQYKRLFSPKEVELYGEIDNYERTDNPDENADVPFTSTYSPIYQETSMTTVDDKLLTRNAAICCYNGYLWDNVSGISFEELLFNYGYFFSGAFMSGFTTTISLTKEIQDDLYNYVKDYLKSMYGSDKHYDNEERNVMNLMYIFIPSITDPNRLPDVFDHQSYLFTDLSVKGFVEPGPAQLVEE